MRKAEFVPEFVYVIYIQSTPEKIWEALIDPEMTKEFWGRHQNRSDWKPGSEWRHVNYDDATDIAVAGTVVESEPPRRLVLTWGRPLVLTWGRPLVLTWGRPNETDVSRVTFEIEDCMGSARLTVTHNELSPKMLSNISAGRPAVHARPKSAWGAGAS